MRFGLQGTAPFGVPLQTVRYKTAVCLKKLQIRTSEKQESFQFCESFKMISDVCRVMPWTLSPAEEEAHFYTDGKYNLRAEPIRNVCGANTSHPEGILNFAKQYFTCRGHTSLYIGGFMQTVTIISVGKLKDAFFEMASEEYLKRLKAFAKVNVIEIKAGVISENPRESEINAVLEKEGEEILKKIPQSAKVVSLCIEGKLYSSEDMAALFFDTALSGCSHVVFIIGGSYGLSEKVKKRSDIRLSMSKMTFPHRLARIMLLEQIYRAYKINSGEAYHK